MGEREREEVTNHACLHQLRLEIFGEGFPDFCEW